MPPIVHVHANPPVNATRADAPCLVRVGWRTPVTGNVRTL
jgi:hypothetical protein